MQQHGMGTLTGARMNRMVYLKAVSSRLWFCTTSAHITSVITVTVTSMAANPDEWRRQGWERETELGINHHTTCGKFRTAVALCPVSWLRFMSLWRSTTMYGRRSFSLHKSSAIP